MLCVFFFKCLIISCHVQEIASLKRQFAELLSDIGFIKEGLRARVIERMSSNASDGVLEATGPEVNHAGFLGVNSLLVLVKEEGVLDKTFV